MKRTTRDNIYPAFSLHDMNVISFEGSNDKLIMRTQSGMIPLIGTWLKRNQDISTEELAQLIKGILQEGILKQVIC